MSRLRPIESPPSRRMIATAALALVGMASAQYAIRIHADVVAATWAAVGISLAAALILGRNAANLPLEVPVRTPRTLPVKILAGVGFAIGVALLVFASYLLTRSWQEWFTRAAPLVPAAALFMSLSLRIFDPPARWTLTWAETGWLAAIVAIGTWMRFHDYTGFPAAYGMHAIEEPQIGSYGYNILHYGARPWEFLLDQYASAAALYFGEPTFVTIRIPFTLASVLTIVAVYSVLRRIASTPAALAGTFLFAVSSWNIIYARCAHAVFPTNLFVVSAVALAVHFARTGRLAVLPWMAVCSGYTLYAYAGYRGTTIVILAFLALLAVHHLRGCLDGGAADERLTAMRGLLRTGVAAGLLLFTAVAMVTPVVVLTTSNAAQPWYYFEAANRSLSNRQYYTEDTSAFVAQRVQRIRDTARIFMHHGDDSNTFNAPGEPMLDPVTSVLFLGGLLVAACYFWRPFNGFFLFMFCFVLLGGAVFVQNLDVRRLQGVTPLVAVFATLFLDRLWVVSRSLNRTLVAFLAVGAGAFAAWWNYDVYFHRMARDAFVRQSFKNQYTALIQFGHERGAGRELLLRSEIEHFFEPSDYSWMIDGVMQGRVLGDLTEILPPRPAPKSDRQQSIVVQLPLETEASKKLISAVYPGTTCFDVVDSDNPYVALAVCDLAPTPEQRPMTMNLTARYWLGSTREGPPVLTRPEPFIGFAMLPRICYREPDDMHPQTDCSVEWEGTVEIPTADDYTFIPVSRHEGLWTAEVEIDGQATTAEQPRHLDTGPHRVVVRATFPRQGETGVRLEWMTPDGPEVVPFYTVGG